MREKKVCVQGNKTAKKSQGNNVAKVLIVNVKENWHLFEVIEATSALPNCPFTLFVADEKGMVHYSAKIMEKQEQVKHYGIWNILSLNKNLQLKSILWKKFKAEIETPSC